jgi:hypothetical protein
MIVLPPQYNYVAAFLTLACNLKCSYCINHLSGPAQKKGFTKGEDWINALNRLILPVDLPVTLQGGEPTVHPHFYQIVKGLREDLSIDLLTNLQFDPIEFSKNISPDRLRRDAKYASIRVTYHPETMKWDYLREKVLWMKEKGFAICVYGILHPRHQAEIMRAQAESLNMGIDFRTKEFLGEYNGQIYGNYRYDGAVFSKDLAHCLCKTSELLIGVDTDIYRCHHDLYNRYNPQGNLLDKSLVINDIFRPCERFGNCNPCDVKIKNNRYQQWGHTSVEIKHIENII